MRRTATNLSAMGFILLVGGALAQAPTGTSPAKSAPFRPTGADFQAQVEDLGKDVGLCTLVLGTGPNDAVHLLFDLRQKSGGELKADLYWATATNGALARVERVKGREAADTSHVTSTFSFKLPPLRGRDGQRLLQHQLTLHFARRQKGKASPDALGIEDEVTVQRGSDRSILRGLARVSPTPTGASIGLWSEPALRIKLLPFSNPPEFEAKVMLGPSFMVLPGGGTASPIAVTVTGPGTPPAVSEKGVVDFGDVTLETRQQSYPHFVIMRGKPLTDYRADFSCSLGPALGVVTNSAVARTAEIVNRPKAR